MRIILPASIDTAPGTANLESIKKNG